MSVLSVKEDTQLLTDNLFGVCALCAYVCLYVHSFIDMCVWPMVYVCLHVWLCLYLQYVHSFVDVCGLRSVCVHVCCVSGCGQVHFAEAHSL